MASIRTARVLDAAARGGGPPVGARSTEAYQNGQGGLW
jgi:hypothetical protein